MPKKYPPQLFNRSFFSPSTPHYPSSSHPFTFSFHESLTSYPPSPSDGQPYVLLNLCFHQLYHAFMWQKIGRRRLFLRSPPSSSPSLHSSSITVVMLAGCSWLHSTQMFPFITGYYPDVGSCTAPVPSNTCRWPYMHTKTHTCINEHRYPKQTHTHTHIKAHTHTTLRKNKCTHKYSLLHILRQLLPPLFMSHKTRNQRTHSCTQSQLPWACHFRHSSGPNICPANPAHAITIGLKWRH